MHQVRDLLQRRASSALNKYSLQDRMPEKDAFDLLMIPSTS